MLSNLANTLISEIYKNVFYIDFSNNRLKYKSKTISFNLSTIIEFLGLCYAQYRNGFKNEKNVFEFIKGSHYFNIEYFTNKKLKTYHNINKKKLQYNYTKFKKLIIAKSDYEQIIEKYVIKKDNGLFTISFNDYKNHNLKNKYPSINFKEDATIYLNALTKFF